MEENSSSLLRVGWRSLQVSFYNYCMSKKKLSPIHYYFYSIKINISSWTFLYSFNPIRTGKVGGAWNPLNFYTLPGHFLDTRYLTGCDYLYKKYTYIGILCFVFEMVKFWSLFLGLVSSKLMFLFKIIQKPQKSFLFSGRTTSGEGKGKLEGGGGGG